MGTDRKVKVLAMGASTFFFSETTPEETTLNLTKACVEALRPDIEWEFAGASLYLGPGMPSRVAKVVGQEKPDLVMLRPPSVQLVQDFVVHRIRERWPGLYNRSVWFSEILNRLAGGGPAGTEGPRGWIFRVPRWFMVKLIGVAPALRVEEAIEVVRETLEGLARLEDVQVVYVLPGTTMEPNIPAAEARRRRDRFATGVGAICKEKGMLLVNPEEEYRLRGIVRGKAIDGWHPGVDDRRIDGDILGEYVASYVGSGEGRRSEIQTT